MQYKKLIIIFAILLFVLGCKGGKKEYQPALTTKDLYTGTDGLEMEFLENAPSEEVFENGPLPVGLRLYNKGVHNIENGYLSLTLEKDYMEVNERTLRSMEERVQFSDSEHINFNLNGQSMENPKGDQDILTFTVNTKNLSKTDPQSETHTSPIIITACYKYQTKATETVCVDTGVYDLKKREKPCEVKTITLDGQGAPVAVTEIKTEMLPDKDNTLLIKPRFTIKVKNLGKGEVIKGNDETLTKACSSAPLYYPEWNIINAKVYISTMDEEDKLDCDMSTKGTNDDGILNLKNKEDSIRCIYEKGFDEKKGTFSTPIYIELAYGYTDTISKDIKIKRIITG